MFLSVFLTSVLNHRLTLTFYKNLARLIILQSAFFQMTIKDSLMYKEKGTIEFYLSQVLNLNLITQIKNFPLFKKGCYTTSGKKSFLDIAVASSAILYLLKDSGHSLLVINDKDTWDLFVPDVITTIRETHKDLFEEFNSHQYVLEFNYRNYRSLDFVLPVTNEFRNFIEDNTSFFEEHDDMCPPILRSNTHALCERICGANISAGYHKNRKRGAFLNLAEWKHTLNVFRNLLKEPQPRFPLSYYVSHSNDSGLPNFREQ